MQTSIWTGTLSAFREKVGGKEPVPAGVAVSAVSASLALALLAKVLEITGRRKDFSGDRDRIAALIDAARAESAHLTELADEDTAAFHEYLECMRGDNKAEDHSQAIDAAIRKAIEIPMETARSAVRGLDICAEGAGIVRGLTAADLGIAASLLSAATVAALLSVDFNLRARRSADRFADTIASERQELEKEALRHADAIKASVKAPLG